MLAYGKKIVATATILLRIDVPDKSDLRRKRPVARCRCGCRAL